MPPRSRVAVWASCKRRHGAPDRVDQVAYLQLNGSVRASHVPDCSGYRLRLFLFCLVMDQCLIPSRVGQRGTPSILCTIGTGENKKGHIVQPCSHYAAKPIDRWNHVIQEMLCSSSPCRRPLILVSTLTMCRSKSVSPSSMSSTLDSRTCSS